MVTQKDIAKRLGINRSTVSAVLNDDYKSKSIPEEKRSHIKKIAREMGYETDDMARALATGNSKTIVYATDFNSLETISKISQVVHSRGYKLDLILPSKYLADIVIAKRAAGVLIHWSDELLIENVKKLKKNNIFCAYSAGDLPFADISIYSDNNHGSKLAADYLIKKGYEKFAVISGPQEVCISRGKVFINELKNYDIQFFSDFFIHSKLHDLYRKVEDFVKNNIKNFPSAVFCTTDQAALMLCFYAEKYGIKIPDDCVVIGYGSLFNCAGSLLPITSVAEKGDEIAEEAASCLIDFIEGKKSGIISRKYPTELFHGVTT